MTAEMSHLSAASDKVDVCMCGVIMYHMIPGMESIRLERLHDLRVVHQYLSWRYIGTVTIRGQPRHHER
jgi:hypothetical protein